MLEKSGYLQDAITYGLPVLVAFAVFIVLMWVVNLSKKESLKMRLHRLAPSEEDTQEYVSRKREGESSGLAATLEPVLRAVGLKPDEYRRLNFYKFYRAGVDPVDGAINYLAYKCFITPIVLLLIAVLLSKDGTTMQMTLYALVSVILFIFSWFGPDLYLKNLRLKRETKLIRAFPDTLDLMLVCTEAGLALDGAIARVTKELGNAYPTITEEFNKTRMELTLLNNREQALTNLAERTDLVPFRSLVASLLQTERFGTSLTETLRVLADEYRNTRLMLAEQKAGRLPVMMTIPLITLLLPSLFLIIMGPAAVKVFAVTD